MPLPSKSPKATKATTAAVLPPKVVAFLKNFDASGSMSHSHNARVERTNRERHSLHAAIGEAKLKSVYSKTITVSGAVTQTPWCPVVEEPDEEVQLNGTSPIGEGLDASNAALLEFGKRAEASGSAVVGVFVLLFSDFYATHEDPQLMPAALERLWGTVQAMRGTLRIVCPSPETTNPTVALPVPPVYLSDAADHGDLFDWSVVDLLQMTGVKVTSKSDPLVRELVLKARERK